MMSGISLQGWKVNTVPLVSTSTTPSSSTVPWDLFLFIHVNQILFIFSLEEFLTNFNKLIAFIFFLFSKERYYD